MTTLDPAIQFAISALLGYLFGAIPFGLVITRLAGLGDIREIGSGNIGATNVLRTGRKDLAAATLILDAGKAGIAALAAMSLFSSFHAGLIRRCSGISGSLFSGLAQLSRAARAWRPLSACSLASCGRWRWLCCNMADHGLPVSVFVARRSDRCGADADLHLVP